MAGFGASYLVMEGFQYGRPGKSIADVRNVAMFNLDGS
jgi:hypothetical protein